MAVFETPRRRQQVSPVEHHIVFVLVGEVVVKHVGLIQVAALDDEIQYDVMEFGFVVIMVDSKVFEVGYGFLGVGQERYRYVPQRCMDYGVAHVCVQENHDWASNQFFMPCTKLSAAVITSPLK